MGRRVKPLREGRVSPRVALAARRKPKVTQTVYRAHFDLGGVFASAGRTLRRQGLAVLLYASVGYIILPLLIQALTAAIGYTGLWRPAQAFGLSVTLGAQLAQIALTTLFGAMLTRLALETMAERRESVGATLKSALRPWLIVLPVSVLSSSAGLLPTILAARHVPLTTIGLLTPGLGLPSLVMSLIWGLALPVAVAEGGNTLTAVVRSARLLGNGRWLFVLFVLGQQLLLSMVSTLILTRVGLSGQMTSTLPARFGLFAALALPGAVVIPLWRLFVAAYYREACRARTGVAPGDVAGVFD
jgi:hypothetical protein